MPTHPRGAAPCPGSPSPVPRPTCGWPSRSTPAAGGSPSASWSRSTARSTRRAFEAALRLRGPRDRGRAWCGSSTTAARRRPGARPRHGVGAGGRRPRRLGRPPGRASTRPWPTAMRRGLAARHGRAAVRPRAVPGRRTAPGGSGAATTSWPTASPRPMVVPAGRPSVYTALVAGGPARAGARRGRSARLVEGDVAYAASPAAERDADWWRARLAGAPEPVRLARTDAAAGPRDAAPRRRAVARAGRPPAGRGLDRRAGDRRASSPPRSPPTSTGITGAHRPRPRACRSPPARARRMRTPAGDAGQHPAAARSRPRPDTTVGDADRRRRPRAAEGRAAPALPGRGPVPRPADPRRDPRAHRAVGELHGLRLPAALRRRAGDGRDASPPARSTTSRSPSTTAATARALRARRRGQHGPLPGRRGRRPPRPAACGCSTRCRRPGGRGPPASPRSTCSTADERAAGARRAGRHAPDTERRARCPPGSRPRSTGRPTPWPSSTATAR